MFKNYIKSILPSPIWKLLSKTKATVHEIPQIYLELTQEHLHQKAISILKEKKPPYNVVFFILDSAVWKFDSLYQLMEKDSRFNPVLFVCPQVNRGKEFMVARIMECFNHFKDRGYNVINIYNEENDTYMEAKDIDADIIFYTNPYKGLIHDNFYISNFRDKLTCYVNYGYMSVDEKWITSLPLHKLVWKFFCEYDHTRHLKAVGTHLYYKNRVVTGYPMYDSFTMNTYNDTMWKDRDHKRKRIIWAPHHSIETDSTALVRYSTFLQYADKITSLRDKYRDKVEFIFKPHPLLKTKLYKLAEWGKERTDRFYEDWATASNSSIADSEYVDLFNSSDAMIHDSASFTTEYLYTRKPVMYLSDESHAEYINPEARLAFGCHYLLHKFSDIENFINDVVLKGNDNLKEARHKFYDTCLVPPNGKSVAENIITEISRSIGI